MKLSRKELLALGIIVGALLIVNIGIFVYRQSGGDTDTIADPIADTEQPVAAPAARLFFFDPNTADSATFIALGLRPNTARAIVHYRKAGGRFRKPDDFARIYTLSREDFLRLRPYIRIQKQYSAQDTGHRAFRHYETSTATPYPAADSQSYSPTESAQRKKGSEYPAKNSEYYANGSGGQRPNGYVRKLRHGQKVDLSTADTTDLKRIPGIGSYYAAKIIRYRNRMGGFVSTEQLKEVYGLPDDICQWVCLGNPQINKMRINSMTFGQLLRHPYLNFEQVKAILNHRQLYGPIRSLNDLRTYDAFCEDDFRRLAPYVDFD